MTEDFLRLSAHDRREALEVAAGQSTRPFHLLEKDVWVVWALNVMFSASFGEHLVFKGGTSLSKAFDAIRRFSEDVDLTYDIRALAGDLTGQGPHPIPSTRSQEKKWSKEIKERLTAWVGDQAFHTVEAAVRAERVPAKVSINPNDDHALLIEYEPLSEVTRYASPVVLLEFGGRATGEPCDPRQVHCDAAKALPDVIFPTATPRVMRAERTFWEKATAIHVLCAGGKLRGGDRFSRHWYDLVQLDKKGYVESALGEFSLAQAVAEHKSMFFAEKAAGVAIDYFEAVNGGLRLLPEGELLVRLKEDYRKMSEDGLLLDAAEPFETLLDVCRQIAARANARGPG
ncbi:nucleotidyl transferase AbiEii/AbiGii toxin family protein [Melittangium boletus]|uniref:Nucleotidyltransferase n=1 Tax=Melittangium boletus DSM 14713 TaxID=1294270 RepID=A0A250IFL0_9BACT|nr:nucleotidyl transferase AbiEii/AbiGii toxin family protein [Melittangium boletus]ATB29716.1 hypothetical protein MEBOL_003171 [Melittangium boletus DSM 14713]